MIEIIGMLVLMLATAITLCFFISLSILVRTYRENKAKLSKTINPLNSTVEEWEKSKQ